MSDEPDPYVYYHMEMPGIAYEHCSGCSRPVGWHEHMITVSGRVWHYACWTAAGSPQDEEWANAFTVATEATPPTIAEDLAAIDWASKTNDEILADVLGLLSEINSAQAAYVPDSLAPVSKAERARMVAAWHGIRRTRGGMWTVAGRRYRTRALAVEAVTNWYATALTRGSVLA